jgi:hypothetical protein
MPSSKERPLATSFENPIRRVSIEGFRAFRDRQEFDLDASAVVLTGPNGTGKTSFLDALQWALLGRLERLEEFRARKSSEHVVNQYRKGERAVVELLLVVGGQSVQLRRVGDHASSSLELTLDNEDPLFGDAAESALQNRLLPDKGMSLDVALATSGLIQQDVMRASLEAKPSERYRHLSMVLGLSALEDYEDATKEAARQASETLKGARAERDGAQARLAERRVQLERLHDQQISRPGVESIREDIDTLTERLDGTAQINSADWGSPISVAVLAREVESLLRDFQSLIGERQVLDDARAALPAEPDPSDVLDCEAQLSDAGKLSQRLEQDVRIAVEALASAERTASDVARLAATAIPQLAESCPVCGQPIDPTRVAAELRARADGGPELSALRERVEAAGDSLRAARTTAAGIEGRLASLRVDLRAWADYRLRASNLEHLSQSVTAQERPVRLLPSLPRSDLTTVGLALEPLRLLAARLAELADLLATGSTGADLSRATAEADRAEVTLAQSSRRLEELASRAALLDQLARASLDARVEVTEKRFRAIQPLVADIFGRLDPHPAFKTLDFELDTYYRRGTTNPFVRDLVADVVADPLLVFSTSQSNIAALSYFLAMGWSAGDRSLPFVLLDDPLQSMDDVNVLGFADLCRHLRTRRQLVLSTHERRIAGLLERKLTPRGSGDRSIVLQFEAWDRSGPSVIARTVEPELVDEPLRVVRAG